MSNYKEDRPSANASHQEQSGSHHRTHDELVQAFRENIRTAESRLALEEPVPPELWIRKDLVSKWLNSPYRSDKERFFKSLAIAWDLLIYDRLEPGSANEKIATRNISDAYRENPTIQLNDTQVRMIDALAVVANITHPRRQREIPIPDKFADIDRLRSSPEYQQRAAEYHERLAKEADAYRRRR